MITATVVITGNWRMEREVLDRKFKEFIGELAEHGAKDIIDNFTLDHVPSYPGEPPAVRTGFLRSSVEGTSVSANLEANIEVGAFYAEALEFGTERIRPRPFVRPAVHRLELAIPALGERKFNA